MLLKESGWRPWRKDLSPPSLAVIRLLIDDEQLPTSTKAARVRFSCNLDVMSIQVLACGIVNKAFVEIVIFPDGICYFLAGLFELPLVGQRKANYVVEHVVYNGIQTLRAT